MLRTLGLARPVAGRLALATTLASASVAAGIALLATSAWLISRAAEHPSIAALGLAVVGVRFFATSRGLFRYGERLVGHDAALRTLADLRVGVYERLERLAPAGVPAFRRGDLLARLVGDVDTLQDLMVRVIPPCGVAVVVGTATVGVIWWLLPAAGLILALALTLTATLVPWLSRSPGATHRGPGGTGAGRAVDQRGRPAGGRARAGRVRGRRDPAGAGRARRPALDRHGRRRLRHRRARRRPQHAAVRSRGLGSRARRHTGGAGRPARRRDVGRGRAHPARRLRAGQRASWRCAVLRARAPVRGTGVRRARPP